MKKIITSLLVIVVLISPLQTNADPQPPEGEFWIAMCVVAAAGIAAGMVYVTAHKCKPKYYWIMDNDQPPTFWVGTTTTKECQINGWKRIGGPYERPQDAPAMHPSPTNSIVIAANPPSTIKVLGTVDMTNWVSLYQSTGDIEDFGYLQPATNTMMFKLEMQ